MTLIYNIGIALYSFLIGLVSPFNQKAKLLKNGRKESLKLLKSISLQGPVVWIHAASLGEFEQGRPIIEALKKDYPQYKVVLTFFSPSGYEVRKNYDLADYVFYLPADTKRNAKKLIDAINSEKVFFIKYEFWYHYLNALKRKNIPVYGVSMIFREKQSFFQWYGGWFKKMLNCFAKFYVQDETSGQLLSGIGVENYSVAGDTRFDRVRDIAKASAEIDLVDRFVGDCNKVIVAGSTWAPDEDILLEYLEKEGQDVKLVIAPHEIHESHIKQIESKLSVPYFRYTKQVENITDCRVLIIDTIGMLSSIYKYGQVAYIGGGFGVGIHNTLEAATYSMPVFFGPNYKKFREARDLIEVGGGFSIQNGSEFQIGMGQLWADEEYLKDASLKAGQYVNKMCGATRKIMDEVF
ncbi:3-deoxy-D-manno-octulosonic acid transferase [Carboxylicivirga linearis]|uniref:3-deoxy-D-manno-octulosonic acid transferase n=1 Tax=Carboxylicivirga linearis TaxID=1628157 RepID=A0ABS5K105_9BACT|nr:glycosyltransferase N-terminal domain-containing protein [Carboxylicivirga linearis]MBS2100793.1 3-deoxy-D-manno-octulosonic acid transferase [Carboxylicivirga linearis]